MTTCMRPYNSMRAVEPLPKTVANLPPKLSIDTPFTVQSLNQKGTAARFLQGIRKMAARPARTLGFLPRVLAAAFVVLLLALFAAPSADASIAFSSQWGGMQPGSFNQAQGMATD